MFIHLLLGKISPISSETTISETASTEHPKSTSSSTSSRIEETNISTETKRSSHKSSNKYSYMPNNTKVATPISAVTTTIEE